MVVVVLGVGFGSRIVESSIAVVLVALIYIFSFHARICGCFIEVLFGACVGCFGEVGGLVVSVLVEILCGLVIIELGMMSQIAEC